MKIITTNGKTKVVISQKEWETIGKKNNWLKTLETQTEEKQTAKTYEKKLYAAEE